MFGCVMFGCDTRTSRFFTVTYGILALKTTQGKLSTESALMSTHYTHQNTLRIEITFSFRAIYYHRHGCCSNVLPKTHTLRIEITPYVSKSHFLPAYDNAIIYGENVTIYGNVTLHGKCDDVWKCDDL